MFGRLAPQTLSYAGSNRIISPDKRAYRQLAKRSG
jgi:hypothetical protein